MSVSKTISPRIAGIFLACVFVIGIAWALGPKIAIYVATSPTLPADPNLYAPNDPTPAHEIGRRSSALNSKKGFASLKIPYSAVEPPLEFERQQAKHVSLETSDAVQITSGFECSTPIKVLKVSPTHYRVKIVTPGLRDWFMFRIAGAKGKTLRIDLNGDDELVRQYWSSLNPVFIDSDNLDDPELYKVSHAPKTSTVAWNGPLLPSTAGQRWHYLSDCWMSDRVTFSFVHRFDNDVMTIAMRVPYTVGYRDREIVNLKASPYVSVIEIGRSLRDRPLYMVKVSNAKEAAEQSKPCILIYGGEHGDEHDAMWVAQSTINFLAGETVSANELRNKFTFLIIPQFDPDASAAGQHSNIIGCFLPSSRTKESEAYANFFQSWINSGRRLDVVLDLHNVQSGELPSIACFAMEEIGSRGAASFEFNTLLLDKMEANGFSVSHAISVRGWMPARLGGWLSRRYGALSLAYEVNAQASSAHLSQEDIAKMSSIFATASDAFFSSSSGKKVMADVDNRRRERQSMWNDFGVLVPKDVDAIRAESIVSKAADARRQPDHSRITEKWIP